MLDGPRKEVKPFHKPAIPFIPFHGTFWATDIIN